MDTEGSRGKTETGGGGKEMRRQPSYRSGLRLRHMVERPRDARLRGGGLRQKRISSVKILGPLLAGTY